MRARRAKARSTSTRICTAASSARTIVELCEQLRALSPQELSQRRPAFEDRRLDELLFRYRARNFRDTLLPAEHEQWQQHCVDRLLHGSGGVTTLAVYEEQLSSLAEGAGARERGILAALGEWGDRLCDG